MALLSELPPLLRDEPALAQVLTDRLSQTTDPRLAKLPEDPHKDASRLRDIAALERRYIAFLRRLHRDEITPDIVEVGWLLEELRVATFAQQLGTAKSVSVTRLAKELVALGA